MCESSIKIHLASGCIHSVFVLPMATFYWSQYCLECLCDKYAKREVYARYYVCRDN